MMVHLGHPLMGKALNSLTRRRYPPYGVSRWTVRVADLPSGLDVLILLHLEELGVNQLRETFHHWIRTLQIPVRKGQLDAALPHTPAISLRGAEECSDRAIQDRARRLLEDIDPDLQSLVKAMRSELTKRLRAQLDLDGKAAREVETERYKSRQGEVSTLIAENTLAKLEREIGKLRVERAQGRLFESQHALDDLERSIEAKQQELERRKLHYEEVRDILDLLTRTKIKIRQGRVNMMMPAPVDFSRLDSEYIGILYEGLLDFELRTAPIDNPIVFLAVGNQPALPLATLGGDG
jgi:hypothetical protein